MYGWNVAASAAFWGPICILEVAVRNAIHDQLVEGRKRDDWWNDPYLNLCHHERDGIQSAISTLSARGTENPSSDQVVAATSFGLWVGLTGEGILHRRELRYETTLWQPRIVKAFPHAGARRRKYIHAELDKVRRLRNRIAHHEPIYAAPLTQIYESILDVSGMVHPDAQTLIRDSSRVREVIADMRNALTSGDVRF
ncbi:MAG: hypothetical protein NTV23_15490 [Propionibacteriales bacterium]|nr:hypothetical protein [Propionibacteriales bacterium]